MVTEGWTNVKGVALTLKISHLRSVRACRLASRVDSSAKHFAESISSIPAPQARGSLNALGRGHTRHLTAARDSFLEAVSALIDHGPSEQRPRAGDCEACIKSSFQILGAIFALPIRGSLSSLLSRARRSDLRRRIYDTSTNSVGDKLGGFGPMPDTGCYQSHLGCRVRE